MPDAPANIGDAFDDIDTPALIVDLDAFDANLNAMAAFAKAAGVRLRPHAKTHKCPTIALMQIAAGAVGQCCQKVGEAEALIEGGVHDVLVTNEIIGAPKLARLARLAARATVGLCFDNADAVAAASRAACAAGVEFGALVEIEVGMQRCGIGAGQPAAELARRIVDAPGLIFRGVQAYHGAAQHLHGAAARERAIGAAADGVRATLEALQKAGLPYEFITGAGTGTYRLEAASGLWNELQAGSYLFMDTEYARIEGDDAGSGRYRDFAHSLFVLSTVMSVPAPGRAIVDAGLKSYSAEKGPPWVHDRTGTEVTAISDEHARLELSAAARPLRLGEKVLLIPGHCDPTINLHDWYIAVRSGRVEALWPITARGRSR
jgi:3-hydroxy-D-aspartate aldolase